MFILVYALDAAAVISALLCLLVAGMLWAVQPGREKTSGLGVDY